MVKMRAVMIPSPPALETAEARSAVPTCIMPPWTTGTASCQYSSFWLGGGGSVGHTPDAEALGEFCSERHCRETGARALACEGMTSVGNGAPEVAVRWRSSG